MTFPRSPFLPLADLHSGFQLRLTFMLLSPNIFPPCEQPCFPFCILSLVLFSCLHFPGLFCPITYHFFKCIYDDVLRVTSSMCSYLQHRWSTGDSICQQLGGNMEKIQLQRFGESLHTTSFSGRQICLSLLQIQGSF